MIFRKSIAAYERPADAWPMNEAPQQFRICNPALTKLNEDLSMRHAAASQCTCPTVVHVFEDAYEIAHSVDLV
jgi:hypothetical protein